MSVELEERITGHASYDSIKRLLQLLEGIGARGLNTDQEIKLGRIHETFIILKEALDSVDPWLVSINSLNSMNNTIIQIINHLTNFSRDKNVQHLNNVFPYIEALLPYFSQLIVIRTPEDIEGVKNAAVSFKRSVGQHLANVEREANETTTALQKNTEKLNDLTGAVDAQKNRIDSVVNEFQNQFLNSQKSKNEDFDKFLKEREAELQELINTYEETYEELEKEQQASFDALNADFVKQVEDQKQLFEALIEELKGKVQTELDQMSEMNKKAEKILGYMSMKGLAQGYKKIANNEGWKALGWNVISILSIIGVLWFGYQFIILHEGTLTWTALVSRMILTGVGITLFTYCAKQATNHRFEERRNRKIELELASLDPYLKDLEEPEQKKVKQSLVDKYFGVELPIPGQQGQAQSQQNVVETITNNPLIMQAIADRVTQMIETK